MSDGGIDLSIRSNIVHLGLFAVPVRPDCTLPGSCSFAEQNRILTNAHTIRKSVKATEVFDLV